MSTCDWAGDLATLKCKGQLLHIKMKKKVVI